MDKNVVKIPQITLFLVSQEYLLPELKLLVDLRTFSSELTMNSLPPELKHLMENCAGNWCAIYYIMIWTSEVKTLIQRKYDVTKIKDARMHTLEDKAEHIAKVPYDKMERYFRAILENFDNIYSRCNMP